MKRIAAALSLALATVTFAAPPIEIGSRLEPFLDEYLIGSQANTALRLQTPRPAETVIKFDDHWEGRSALTSRCSKTATATACITGAIPSPERTAQTGK